MALIIERAMIVEGRYDINGITEDPNDDMFIACALEADADYIVSRDPHLRNIKHYQRIQIIGAATFIEKVKKQSG
jgi:predicted nucleic acid-binding protein